MKKLQKHIRNYFNLSMPLPALMFAILYMLVTFLWSFLLVSFVSPDQIQGVFEGEANRFGLSLRLFMLSYELALVPLYIKRILDIGWQGRQRDMALAGLLLAPVLNTVMSDGGFEMITSIMVFLRILSLVITLGLFFMPSKQK